MSSWDESQVIKALHQKAMLEKYAPLLKEISKYDSPDLMIKKALPMSVLGLIVSQFSENEGVALKARTEVINRGLGKPVERTVNIYGDIAQLNEKDLDNQILQLFKKAEAPIQLTAGRKRSSTKAQGRKPRKSDPFVTVEAASKKAKPATEAGITSGSKDEGTS